MHTLRSLRVMLGLNQAEWAKKLGVAPNTISRWEQGKSEPGLTVLHRMSMVSGVSLDDISLPSDTNKLNGETN